MRTLQLLLGASIVGLALQARAHEAPDPAKWQAALQACQESKLNTGNVTLPPPTPGQKPNFTPEQKQLLMACEKAGILPKHHMHHHDE